MAKRFRIFRRRRIFAAVAVLLVLLAAAVLLEFGARVVYAVRLRHAGYLAYPFFDPYAQNVFPGFSAGVTPNRSGNPSEPRTVVSGFTGSIPLNRSGFRGKDYEEAKGARYLVVTAGGSSTFSPECPPGASYPEVLERIWNERLGAKAVAVVNRAAVGMAAAGIAGLFQTDIANAKPDLVTVNSAYNSASSRLMLNFYNEKPSRLRRWFWGRSLLYTASYDTALIRGHLRAAPAESVVRGYRESLVSIIDQAREHGIALLFIAQPIRSPEVLETGQPDGTPSYAMFYEASLKTPIQRRLVSEMLDLARERGVPFVDPRNTVETGADPRANFANFLHLSVRGSELFARDIARQVDEKYGGLAGIIAGRQRGGE